MSDFYPFLDPQLVQENFAEPPIAQEWDYDIDTAQFKMTNGKMKLVFENEALKIKIWKLFMSERYRWVVFPWSYGHEIETLIGRAYTQGYINSEAERFVKEAIFKNLSDYITRLDNFKVWFDDGTLYVDFIAITVYGKLKIDRLLINTN